MTTILHRKLPRRTAPVLFALVMSVTLGGAMSGTVTAYNTGLGAGFLARWLDAWVLAVALAFPSVALLAPRVRAFVDRITD